MNSRAGTHRCMPQPDAIGVALMPLEIFT